jgi:hypothetical protein
MKDHVAERMVELVKMDPKRLDPSKHGAVEAIEKLMAEAKKDAPAYTGDTWFYRIVVIGLAAVAVIAAVGYIVLKGPIPEALVALGSAAVGAMAGLFAPSPSNKIRIWPRS